MAQRILIVDDEFSSTEALALILVEEGYEVATASNGRQALAKLDAFAADLIITDYMMPVLNGAELVRAVRVMPSYAHTPILVMSGAPQSMLPADIGDMNFLRKPFNIDRLLHCVSELLSGDAPGS